MIRDYRPEDEEAIKALHREQGLEYACPDFNNPLFLVKKVREIDGKIVGALALRITAETFLLCSGTPRDKMACMEELQPEVLVEAHEKGLDDVVCVIPPSIFKRFRKRLVELGWSKDRDWPMFSRPTKVTN